MTDFENELIARIAKEYDIPKEMFRKILKASNDLIYEENSSGKRQKEYEGFITHELYSNK